MFENADRKDGEKPVPSRRRAESWQVTRGQTEGYAFRPLRKDLAEWQMTDRDE